VDRACGAHGGGETNAYRDLAKKPAGKRSLRRPLSRMENNFKINLTEIGWDRIHLAQDTHKWWALMNTGRHIQVTQNKGDFLTS
jgi:hypothetical protein